MLNFDAHGVAAFLGAAAAGGALVPQEALRLLPEYVTIADFGRGMERHRRWGVTPEAMLRLLQAALAAVPEEENPQYMPEFTAFPTPRLDYTSASGRPIQLWVGEASPTIGGPGDAMGVGFSPGPLTPNVDERWGLRASAAAAAVTALEEALEERERCMRLP